MIHESLYKSALESLQSGKAEAKEYFVCQVCGFTAEGKAPDRCPVCGAPQTQFSKVD
jgi:rubrerythrin